MRPEAPEGREGSSLNLICEAESNEVLEFQWLREKVPRWPGPWGGWGQEWPLICLSPQTGEVLEKGPELRLHNLNREAGGGYLCMVSVPRVPGLNSTQLVNVAVSGEAL